MTDDDKSEKSEAPKDPKDPEDQDENENDDHESESDGESEGKKSKSPPKLDAFENVDAIKKPEKEWDEAFAASRSTWGFPTFARDFPADDELAALVAAFAAGDYATVRTGAPALAAKTTNEEVKKAAALLRARIEPDPTSRLFFALTAALMVFLMVWWATHDGPQHTAPAPPKPPPTVEIVK